MFDPTAYENLKVVIEGLMYEYDLNGEITILERNDLVNLADMSRSFEIQFIHHKDLRRLLYGKVELVASFKQLAAEWILTNEQPGARLLFRFCVHEERNEILKKRMLKYIKETYMPQFHYHWKEVKDSEGNSQFEIIVEKFNPVTEDSIDDLPSIIDMSIESLQVIFEMLNSSS
ncbi:hypothetical protein [Fervidibacillus halotolerans]|uniref:Group-specific protein n=1 Tax=Fervidibacillus halotolerans TaxID=2980027 RepID=A0A9E8M2E2_9BACI|nr:hypothetical protein [Fervidibacillus halotolerans]WAA13271.1 hypothetical protein OE105_03880 [Fervidibacillus halotolerans]